MGGHRAVVDDTQTCVRYEVYSASFQNWTYWSASNTKIRPHFALFDRLLKLGRKLANCASQNEVQLLQIHRRSRWKFKIRQAYYCSISKPLIFKGNRGRKSRQDFAVLPSAKFRGRVGEISEQILQVGPTTVWYTFDGASRPSGRLECGRLNDGSNTERHKSGRRNAASIMKTIFARVWLDRSVSGGSVNFGVVERVGLGLPSYFTRLVLVGC